jgi:hypothetical protein
MRHKSLSMKLLFIALSFIFTLFVSCKKNNPQQQNSIVGSWIFTNQSTVSYAYPSVLNDNPFPIASSTSSTTVDSIKITFDNSLSYTFANFRLPIDNGTYIIAQDSFLVINPDTAGFVKFNYTVPTITAIVDTTPGVLPVPVYAPYSNFHYVSDTILFKKTMANNIVFSGVAVTKANQPILPSNDTLVLTIISNYFKKQ